MTNEYNYQEIKGSRKPSSNLDPIIPSGLTPEKSDSIMKNLVKRIEEYEKAREMETTYYKNIDKEGRERIIQVKMISKDQIIQGEIKYEPAWGFSLCSFSANVNAEFNFNSNNPADKEEYLGLAKIIRGM